MSASKKLVRSLAVIGVGAISAGCSTGTETNFERSEAYTDMLAAANLDAPSTLAGESGTAVYNGIATAEFSGGDLDGTAQETSFEGTADARLEANFDSNQIEGELTDWVDGDPRNYDLRGEIVLSDGTIDANSGAFEANFAGNIERRPELLGSDGSPLLLLLGGTVEGQFFDSDGGDVASHVIGEFNSFEGSEATVSGGFVAER